MKKQSAKLSKAICLSLILGISASLPLPGTAWAGIGDFRTPEYFYMGNGGDKSKTYSPLDLLNAASAYDQGYTGKGITVGEFDGGVNTKHQEFVQKTNTNFSMPADYGDNPSQAQADAWFAKNGHGTHVAGIIAASKDGVGMHGVAYDANVVSYTGYLNESGSSDFPSDEKNYNLILEKGLWNDPEIKVINNSWGFSIDTADGDNLKAFKANNFYWPQLAEGITDPNAKLMLFAASNEGFFAPGGNTFAYLNDENARNNIIAVGSLSDTAYFNSDGKITSDKNLLGTFSNLALGNEERFILGTGENIYSADSSNTTGYVHMTGTSMATPSVTGVAALVQQAFPYLTGKQIGDVLLSTANNNVVLPDNTQVNTSGVTYTANMYLTNGKTLSSTEVEQKLKNFLTSTSNFDLTIRVFNDVNLESLIGQGVADAGKAVQGLAELNARRLTNNDYSTKYTVNGTSEGQAIYSVDTKGYTSEWKNDISEVKVGYLAADSTEADLQKRYNYYKTLGKYTEYKATWDGTNKQVTITETTHNGIYLTKSGSYYQKFLDDIIQYYNDNVNKLQSDLIDKHVGLKKTGEGILILSGNNTYKGATIVDEGTLAINGSIDGDAYAEGSGYLTGNGTIGRKINGEELGGNVYNYAILGALTPSGENTTLTIIKNLTLGNGSSLAYTSYNGYVGKIAVGGSITATENKANLTLNPDISYRTSDKFTNTNFSKWVTVNGAAATLQVAQGEGDAVYKTDLLTARYHTQDDGTVTFGIENNYSNPTADENNAVRALNEVDSKGTHDAELLPLLNAKKGTSRTAVGQLVNNGNAQSALAVAQSNHVGQALGQRWNQVQRAQVSVPVQVAPKSLTKQESEVPAVTVQVPVEVEPIQSMWAKMDKAWGNVGGASTNMYGLTLGYDKQYNANNRAGVFFSYAKSNFSASEVLDKQQDYRVGLYNGFHKGAQDVLVYLDFGTQRHDAERYMSRWSPDNTSEYNSRILELGAEYKYDLHAADGKIFHVSPYINGKLARYWQDAYKEGYWAGQSVDSYSSNYAATELGLEISRQFKLGSYSARLGFKEIWTGNSTDLTYNIASTSVTNTSHATSDKHFVTASLTGTAKLNNHGWSLEGETHLEKGAHDKNYGISATLKWEW